MATGHSDDDDSHRLAACTLLIGAPIDKNRQRMVDGKIENLWLRDAGCANRLDNVRMLATLLAYVQDFCTSIEVPHISSIQNSDHPAWLRDFFTIAGFNRCECLKPEAGSQRYRACLKLGSTNQVVAPESHKSLLRADKQNESEKKKEIDLVPGVSSTPQALPVLPVARASPTKQKPSLNLPKVTEAIRAKQRPSVSVPKAMEIASSTNDQRGNGSAMIADASPAMPFSTNQALAWLSQNKQILSPVAALPASSPTQPHETSSKAAQIPANGSANNSPGESGEKRKSKESEATEQSKRQRRDNGESEKTHTKKSLRKDEISPKFSSQSKQPALPAARYSFTMASRMTKPKRSNDDLTDAHLAQVDEAAVDAIPKQVKEEPTSSLSGSSPPPETRHHRSQDLPPKMLTCYYWKHQGGCNKRDEDCSYAHYDTGHDASAPNTWKYTSAKRKYSLYPGQYFGVGSSSINTDGISIKGSHDGKNGSVIAPSGPRADVEGSSYGGLYDSYRPRS